ncbi:maleylpyruvate isomerase family mycothiol-dependent enzyme [Amycolatopsis sp. NPDC051903]|uniref:maleylpyruvate isomerase family mycothiol-dependent enzyme n=1 Tax=Amycolatopsis sp. NPDC051903 TaxID=3363936 RepID=UPI00379D94FA
MDNSSTTLARSVAGLSPEGLQRPSYAQAWNIADVLAHLGASAEISTKLLEQAVMETRTGPAADSRRLIQERWLAMSPVRRREAWLEADARHRQVLSGLSPDQRASLRVPLFAGSVTLPVYVGYLLSEQSVHAWDVEVGLDPTATIPRAEVDLLWQRIDRVATRFRDLATLTRLAPCQMSVELDDRVRSLALIVDTELHIYPCEAYEPVATISGSAEAVLRLVYGRNRPDDAVTVTGKHSLAELRALFPGV